MALAGEKETFADVLCNSYIFAFKDTAVNYNLLSGFSIYLI